MRIVLDTNLYISAFVSQGLCAEIYLHCLEHHQLILSDYILKEVQRNLARKFGQSASDVSETLQILAEGSSKVTPQAFDKPVSRDPTDDPVIGTAVAGKAHYLVSGDQDLLLLKHYGHIQIVSPRVFWAKTMGFES